MARVVKVVVVYNNIPLLAGQIAQRLAPVMEKAAKSIREHVHSSMQETKHGRTYIIGGKLHVASAPGESPAVLTGTLISKIKEHKVKDLVWEVDTGGVPWGLWELGMRGPASERPFLRPATTEEVADFIESVKKAVRGV